MEIRSREEEKYTKIKSKKQDAPTALDPSVVSAIQRQ